MRDDKVYDQSFLCELIETPKNINIHIRGIKVLQRHLSFAQSSHTISHKIRRCGTFPRDLELNCSDTIRN